MAGKIIRSAQLLLLLACGAAVSDVGAGSMYSVTDLGDLPGGRDLSVPDDLNNAGQVVGYSATAGGDRGFFWHDGVMIDIGDLPGGLSESVGTGINASGQVTGWSSGSIDARAILWDPINGMTDLGVNGQAWAINDSGQVVGRSGALAFVWDSVNGMQSLGELPGGQIESTAQGINTAGQIVGVSTAATGDRAFLWQDGVMTDLGDLPGGLDRSTANSINDGGQVVGTSHADGGERAFLWSDGVMINLGVLPGWELDSQAGDINDAGQIVGTSFSATGGRAFVWDPVDGMQQLDRLIDPTLGWTISAGYAINDLGQIAVSGLHPVFGQHALLLTPISVPEPGGLVMLGLGVAGVGFMRRRRAA